MNQQGIVSQAKNLLCNFLTLSICSFCTLTSAGILAEPITISSAEDFMKIGNDDAFPLDGEYIQSADIDFSSERFFLPVGIRTNPLFPDEKFVGSYDGAGYQVSNLTYSMNDGSGSGPAGLFYSLGTSATVSNLELHNFDIYGQQYVGCLAGLNSGTISNCHADGVVTGPTENGGNFVGGLVGSNNRGEILNSSASCTVTGKGGVGGLVGVNGPSLYDLPNSSLIEGCFASGYVVANVTVGGLVGSSKGILRDCYAVGTVRGDRYVGGLTGYNRNRVERCYSTGSVSGEQFVNGFIGDNHEELIIQSSFWNTETSGFIDSNGLGSTGLTTTGMVDLLTYQNAGWNIADSITYTNQNIWTIVQGVSYPILTWQTIGNPVPDGLTLDLGVSGDGSVDVVPSGSYSLNQPVLITATSGENGLLHHWVGKGLDLEGKCRSRNQPNPLPLVMVSNQNVTCVFRGVINIDSAGDLGKIGNDPQYPLSGVYRQTADINMVWATDFSPIGMSSTGDKQLDFTGEYDGQGFEIRNLTIDLSEEDKVGLFSSTSQIAIISNVKLVDCQIQGDRYVGGLVGENQADITNCSVEGVVVAADRWAGGLIGRTDFGKINDCYSICEILSEYSSGGLIGTAGMETSIANCYSVSKVTSNQGEAGGLVSSSLASITNCWTECDVKGTDHVGGLVGTNQSLIKQCYSRGTVVGDTSVGGLVGYEHDQANASEDSYSLSFVSGSHYMGGLIGYVGTTYTTNPPAKNCFYSGIVLDDGELVGKLVGRNEGNEPVDCFWDHSMVGQKNNQATGRSTSEMTSLATYFDAGWDIEDSESFSTNQTWTLVEGVTSPILVSQLTDNQIPTSFALTSGTVGFGSLDLSDAGPYTLNQPVQLEAVPSNATSSFINWQGFNDVFSNLTQNPLLVTVYSDMSIVAMFDGPTEINSPEGLQKIGNDPLYPMDGEYALTANIDLSGIPNFDPIGSYSPISSLDKSFKGIFDGQGFEIQNLTINRPDEDQVGLFASIKDQGTVIQNLHLVNCNVVGKDYVGGLLGQNFGATIVDCSASGDVAGNFAVGGLAGFNKYKDISQCFASGTVKGNLGTGGLVGRNEGTISISYSFSNVFGDINTGGFIGYNSSTINDCYSIGAVAGVQRTGSFAGIQVFNQITDCYAVGGVQGSLESGGFVGLLENGIIESCLYQNNSLKEDVADAKVVAEVSEAEMLSLETYTAAGWNIDSSTEYAPWNIWTLVEGATYPILVWQVPGGVISQDLTLEIEVDGFGSVELTPEGQYTVNQLVVLEAVPEDKATFIRWETSSQISEANGLSQTTPLHLVVTSNQHLKAVFLGGPGMMGFMCR